MTAGDIYVKVKLRKATAEDFTELGKRRLGLLYFLENQRGYLEAYIFSELHLYEDLEPFFSSGKVFVVDARMQTDGLIEIECEN